MTILQGPESKGRMPLGQADREQAACPLTCQWDSGGARNTRGSLVKRRRNFALFTIRCYKVWSQIPDYES